MTDNALSESRRRMNHGLARRPRLTRNRHSSPPLLWSRCGCWRAFGFPIGMSTPVQPLLTQLAPRPAFDNLASEIAQLRPRIEPLLVGSALRFHDDAAVTLLDTRWQQIDGVVGFDPLSRLAVGRAGLCRLASVPWTPRNTEEPRY